VTESARPAASHKVPNESYPQVAARRSLALLVDGASWSLSTWSHFVVAILLAWILSEEFGVLLTGTWATCLCLAVGWQARYLSQLQDLVDLSSTTVAHRLRGFTRSAWVVGLLWALAAGLLFPETNPELRWFLLFVIGGMSLSAVGTQHIYLPACHASMTLALPCLAMRYVLIGDWLEGLLLILYLAVIIRLAHMLHRFSTQTARLQYDRDLLLNELVDRADELDRARQDAELANKAKSRFLAQASHDLRQPLHAIGLFVETISHSPDLPQIQRVIGRVRTSLDVFSNLFDSLLDVSMLDTGELKVASKPVAVARLFNHLRHEFNGPALAANVELRVARTKQILYTDEAMLTRVVMNLLSNAIRYSPNQRVLIGLRWRKSGAYIEVRDSGIGIAAHEQQRIFEEFVRINKSTGGPTPGLGLGLSIVGRAADLLGVAVELNSAPGFGSRFTVGPFLRAPATATELVDTQTVTKSVDLLADLHILVVDDDSQSRDSMGELLSSWGCRVTVAGSARELPSGDWDAVVCDYELGDGMFGDQEIAYLRQRQPDMPGILITGSTAADVLVTAKTAKLPLLRKPVRPAQLRSALLHVML